LDYSLVVVKSASDRSSFDSEDVLQFKFFIIIGAENEWKINKKHKKKSRYRKAKRYVCDLHV
jgi:hypothetical protein